MKKIITIILLIFVFLVSYFVYINYFIENNFKNYEVEYIVLNDKKLKAYISDTEEKIILWLSNTKKLKENESMLFVFKNPRISRFWMKDMNYSIDILFFNKDKKLIYIKENATPKSFPKTFWPEEKILYVLETNANFSSKNNINIWDKLEIE